MIESGKMRITINRLMCGVVVLGAALVGGCASAPAGSRAATSSGDSAVLAGQKSPHAECLVCKYDADLACVDVEVEKDTPKYTYNGKAYYFCSDSCCQKFQKDPAKYVNQK